MKKTIELFTRIETGFTYSCNFKGSVEEYALMWLKLTNNKREYNCFEKITNDSGNGVYVLVNEDQEHAYKIADYLESIGLEVYSKDETKIVTIDGELPFGDDSLWDSEFVIGEIY